MASGFSFNAYALGLGGAINSNRETIDSAGSIVLAGVGGSGESNIASYRSPKGSVTAGSIVTTVKGDRTDSNRYKATASVQIVGLVVKDWRTGAEILTARYLSALITSIHQTNGGLTPDSNITFQATIEDLKAGDETIDATLDVSLCNAGDTFDSFIEAFNAHPDRAELARHYGWLKSEDLVAAKAASVVVPDPFKSVGTIPLSVMHNRTRLLKPEDANGFTVPIPKFGGKLHIGEAILKRGRRRLNLLRLNLKAPLPVGDEADTEPPEDWMSFACLEGNGTEIMP